MTPDFVDHLKAGEYDEHLVDIMNAVKLRVQGGKIAIRWKLTLSELEVTEDDLTIGEMERIERAANTNWSKITPSGSAVMCAAILRVVLQTRAGLSEEKANERIGSLTAAQILEAITEYEVRNPPKGTAT